MGANGGKINDKTKLKCVTILHIVSFINKLFKRLESIFVTFLTLGLTENRNRSTDNDPPVSCKLINFKPVKLFVRSKVHICLIKMFLSRSVLNLNCFATSHTNEIIQFKNSNFIEEPIVYILFKFILSSKIE